MFKVVDFNSILLTHHTIESVRYHAVRSAIRNFLKFATHYSSNPSVVGFEYTGDSATLEFLLTFPLIA